MNSMEKLIGFDRAPGECDHAAAPVTFDEEAAKGLSAHEVRARWPRFFGNCPGCGTQLIKYASQMHYYSGDW
ncbi:MAG TPA: hypothetical protein VHV32_19020 [Candidatus Angelobacter sp.]|jgi:hypothetical protein|nr:hypothetical protein [Candidatus Angelobacter sp.]